MNDSNLSCSFCKTEETVADIFQMEVMGTLQDCSMKQQQAVSLR